MGDTERLFVMMRHLWDVGDVESGLCYRMSSVDHQVLKCFELGRQMSMSPVSVNQTVHLEEFGLILDIIRLQLYKVLNNRNEVLPSVAETQQTFLESVIGLRHSVTCLAM